MKKGNECYSPIEIAKKIEANEFVLPRFQRELDWKTDRIAKLFDSIYRGFYINLIVLWCPKGNKHNYFFVRDFEHGKHNSMDKTDTSSGKKFVLDGQQRFEAIYIGLCGSYREKNGVVKELYFYIDETGKDDNFVFVSENEYKERNMNNCFLLKISDIRKYNDRKTIVDNLIKEINEEINDLNMDLAKASQEKEKKRIIREIGCYNEKIKAIKKSKKRISTLYDKLYSRSIKYHLVGNALDDDSVEELFVRMNTGGSQLSNAEIILSKLSTQWKKLNARDQVNGLIDDINHYHKDSEGKWVNDYSINLDFVMKAMLVLLDQPSVSFKIKNIINDGDLIICMQDKFPEISEILKITFNFVNKYGFNHDVLRSNNAVISIAYLIMKLKDKRKDFLESNDYENLRKSLIKWLCVTIISNYWSGANDTTLVSIRKAINNYNGDYKDLNFFDYFKSNSSLPAIKKINYNNLLSKSYDKNNGDIYPILCVLYLNSNNFIKYVEGHYDIDHIFPESKFNDECYDANNINKKKRKFYTNNYNLLPNLQLLKSTDNRKYKRDLYFDEWVRKYYKTPTSKKQLLKDNYIDKVYSFDEFRIMFEKRKETLTRELKKIIE